MAWTTPIRARVTLFFSDIYWKTRHQTFTSVPFNPTYGLGAMTVKTLHTDTTLDYGEIGSPGCQLGTKNCPKKKKKTCKKADPKASLKTQ